MKIAGSLRHWLTVVSVIFVASDLIMILDFVVIKRYIYSIQVTKNKQVSERSRNFCLEYVLENKTRKK